MKFLTYAAPAIRNAMMDMVDVYKRQGVYKAARSLGADKVYGMKYGIEGLLKEELLELNVLLDDRMSIELLKRTPSSYLGSCRFKLPDPDTDATPFVKLFTLFDKYDICAVFYIGGNDSMDTIAKLSRYGQQVGSSVRFIGVPKTDVYKRQPVRSVLVRICTAN